MHNGRWPHGKPLSINQQVPYDLCAGWVSGLLWVNSVLNVKTLTSRHFQPGEGPSRGFYVIVKTSPINRLQHFSVSVSAWSIEEWVTVRRDKCGRSLSLFTITLANLHGNFGNHITKTIICTKIDWIWLNNISCCISVVAELLGVAFMAIGWIWMDRSTEMKDTKVQGIFTNVSLSTYISTVLALRIIISSY